MLAKDIKIKNILKQRAFIMNQLSKLDTREDGDSAYLFVGHIYPENIYYFKVEGFDVNRVESDMMTAATKGMPVYLFTPSDKIELTEEEMKEAEKYQQEAEAEKKAKELFFGELLGSAIADALAEDDEDTAEDDEE